MLRRSQFTIATTVLFTAALVVWTAMAFEDLDAISPLRPAAPSILLTAADWATHPVTLYAAVLLAGAWAWRRSFHSLAGATVLGVALTAASATLIDHYAALGPDYPAPRVAAATVGAIMFVTLARTTRLSRRVAWAWIAAAVAVLLLTAAVSLWLGEAQPTGLIAGLLLGGTTGSLANLLADVHVLRPVRTSAHLRRAAVVYNPAKVRDVALLHGMVDGELAEHGWAPALWLATAVEDPGAGMAREALDAGVDLILIAGGDGTVRVTLGALSGSDVATAIIPSGTGNLLARNLGIPLDTARAVDLALDGTASPVDLLKVTGLDSHRETYAAVMTGMGADAAVLGDADERLKKQIGPAAYVVAGLSHIRATPVPARITVDDGEPLLRDASLIEVGNVGDLQAGVSLMPQAKADDGLLDVLVASPRHVGDVAQMMAGVLLQSTREPLLDRMVGASVRVEVTRPMPFQIDGDVVGDTTSLSVDVVPGAVRIVQP